MSEVNHILVEPKSKKSLEDLIRDASTRAAVEMQEKGRVTEHFIFGRDGAYVDVDDAMMGRIAESVKLRTGSIIDKNSEEDREKLGFVMRLLIKAGGVDQYLYFCEAWALAGEGDEQKFMEETKGGISGHPKRYEIINYIAEDKERQLHGTQSIIRPAGQPAVLHDDLMIEEWEAGGRFAGMFKHNKDVERIFHRWLKDVGEQLKERKP